MEDKITLGGGVYPLMGDGRLVVCRDRAAVDFQPLENLLLANSVLNDFERDSRKLHTLLC